MCAKAPPGDHRGDHDDTVHAPVDHRVGDPAL
jgi:hypothetical protein